MGVANDGTLLNVQAVKDLNSDGDGGGHGHRDEHTDGNDGPSSGRDNSGVSGSSDSSDSGALLSKEYVKELFDSYSFHFDTSLQAQTQTAAPPPPSYSIPSYYSLSYYSLSYYSLSYPTLFANAHYLFATLISHNLIEYNSIIAIQLLFLSLRLFNYSFINAGIGIHVSSIGRRGGGRISACPRSHAQSNFTHAQSNIRWSQSNIRPAQSNRASHVPRFGLGRGHWPGLWTSQISRRTHPQSARAGTRTYRQTTKARIRGE